MVMATWRAPVAGSTRVTRLPVRSVTQRKLSGPQVSSHGPARPETRTLRSKRLVPRVTDSGPSWARRARAARRARVTGRVFIRLGFYRILGGRGVVFNARNG